MAAADPRHRRAPAPPRQAAFSYEGAADEASFAIGPALVGLSVAAVSPSGALVLAAALLAVFGSAFALDPSARLTHAQERPVGTGRLVTPAYAVLVGAQLSIGMLFGATQTGATVLATDAGTPGVAGLVHATLGVGSAVAGLATAYVPERIGHERRALVAAWALLVLALPLLAVGSLVSATVTVLFLGVAVAPYMIAVFSLAERVVPPPGRRRDDHAGQRHRPGLRPRLQRRGPVRRRLGRHGCLRRDRRRHRARGGADDEPAEAAADRDRRR